MIPRATSWRTRSGSRARGSPQPPPPQVSKRRRSPRSRMMPSPRAGSLRSRGVPGLRTMPPVRPAIGRHERVLHARGQLRALAEHAHVADHARPAPMEAGPTRVRPHRVALDAQREVALDVLDGVVLLSDVVDDVDAVREGTGAQAHPEAFDAEDGPPARLVPGAEVVEDVHGRARGNLAAIGLS